jgi:hypothetical protein
MLIISYYNLQSKYKLIFKLLFTCYTLYATIQISKEVKGYVKETLKEGSGGVMSSVIEKPVLGVSDIQKHLGIGRRQAYSLANSGEFFTVRVGTRILVDREVFKNWLKGGQV